MKDGHYIELRNLTPTDEQWEIASDVVKTVADICRGDLEATVAVLAGSLGGLWWLGQKDLHPSVMAENLYEVMCGVLTAVPKAPPFSKYARRRRR